LKRGENVDVAVPHHLIYAAPTTNINTGIIYR
jgi:hypothetical protein